MKRILVELFDFFASIRLAVILILTLATILAVGTFYEAAHGTPDAQRVIYKSWFVTLEMFLLIMNLACAAIDRMPWKKHHVGFVITHAGIITLLMGSFITQQRGIDGNLAIGINESSNNFSVDDTELHVYQSFEGKPFSLLLQQPVDFDRRSPASHNYKFNLVDDDTLRVVTYIQKSLRTSEVKESTDLKQTSAVKFRLYNERVNVAEWLGLDGRIPPFYDLGPAQITFIRGPLPLQPKPHNQILIFQNPETLKLGYAIFSAKQIAPTSTGPLELAKDYATGWMNIKFRLDAYYKNADSRVIYVPAGEDDKETIQAVELEVNQNKGWFELESPHEIKGNKSSYFVAFARKKYDLGFDLTLQKFKMLNYGGSLLPMSYESTVLINSKDQKTISMNEPLKFNAYTIYQSSFEQNERGEPIVSVFSINYDPGRPVKYTGALGIVAGIAVMFYFKPRWTKKKRVRS